MMCTHERIHNESCIAVATEWIVTFASVMPKPIMVMSWMTRSLLVFELTTVRRIVLVQMRSGMRFGVWPRYHSHWVYAVLAF